MAVTIQQFNELKGEVKDHDEFINGCGDGKNGAKSRLILIEDSLARMNKATGYLITASITVIVGVIVWILTNVLPKLIAETNSVGMLFGIR